MVIIDPNVEGCTVYNDMMVSYIKGRPSEVCRSILDRVCCGYDHLMRPRQIITVGVVRGEVGDHYKHCFQNMGLQYLVDITSKHIECVLPIICDPEFCDPECRTK